MQSPRRCCVADQPQQRPTAHAEFLDIPGPPVFSVQSSRFKVQGSTFLHPFAFFVPSVSSCSFPFFPSLEPTYPLQPCSPRAAAVSQTSRSNGRQRTQNSSTSQGLLFSEFRVQGSRFKVQGFFIPLLSLFPLFPPVHSPSFRHLNQPIHSNHAVPG